MCFLPRMKYLLPVARENIAFGGLNELPKIQIGELRAAANMDNSVLPVLKARDGRYVLQQLTAQAGDSDNTVYSWNGIFSTDGIFVKIYVRSSPGILPQVTIKYTLPGDFTYDGQPKEESETGESIPVWVSVQRSGKALICLPSDGRRLYGKSYTGPEGNYYFFTLSTSEWENADESYNDMCLFADRVVLAGKSEGKASIRISSKNAPFIFTDFLNEDGSLKLTGSYFETLLSEPLTACCPYNSGVILFSSSEMFILQGTNTSNYRTTKIAGIGCIFKDTAVICLDVLYWLAPDGVYAYTGGFPKKISDKLPDISNVQKASAGTDGKRYYLSVQDQAGKGKVYVYCPQNGTWIQEDEQFFKSFAFYDGALQAVNDEQMLSFNSKQSTEDVPWSFETAVYGEGDESLKKLRAVILDMEGEDKYPVTVSVKPQLGEAIELGSFYINNRAVYRLPVKACACQIQSLIIEGRGKAQIYSTSREYVVGGIKNVVASPRY